MSRREPHDVRTALLAARAAGLPVSVRNGSQDWVGRALRDGGLDKLIRAQTLWHKVNIHDLASRN